MKKSKKTHACEDKSLGVCPQVQCEYKCALDLLHCRFWKLAKLPPKTYCGQGTKPLNVGHGILIEKTKPWQPYLVLTLPVLSRQRYIQNQRAGRVGIIARDDNDWPHLGR